MIYLFYFSVCLGFLLLQTAILPALPLLSRCYDIIIPWVVFLGIAHPARESLPVVFFLGFSMDSLSGAPFGLVPDNLLLAVCRCQGNLPIGPNRRSYYHCGDDHCHGCCDGECRVFYHILGDGNGKSACSRRAEKRFISGAMGGMHRTVGSDVLQKYTATIGKPLERYFLSTAPAELDRTLIGIPAAAADPHPG
jgi:hypothetical protein